jgi:hypothetical protein
MDWHVSLIVAAAVFLAFILFRFRPATGGEGTGQARADLKEARQRLEAAKSDDERIEALCAAGAASAKLVSGGGRAVQYYLRALKLRPSSPELIDRVAVGLARRPRGLETIMWRRLGGDQSWRPEDAAVVASILRHLGALYGGPLKNSVRARAFANMLTAMSDKK